MQRHRDLVTLGARIRTLREERGWSQEAFAHHCGLDRTYYGGIERGERNVAVINLLKVARGLEVNAGSLFADADERPSSSRQ